MFALGEFLRFQTPPWQARGVDANLAVRMVWGPMSCAKQWRNIVPDASLQDSGGHAVVEAASRASRAAGDWRRVDVPGGYLMWSSPRKAINAHCLCEGHGGARRCKWDRIVKAGDRPLGRQMAWLQLGCHGDACATRLHHQDLKAELGKAHYRALRQAGRDEALRLAATNQDMAELIAFESPSGGDEAEPHVVK